jgi:hypothetical protein
MRRCGFYLVADSAYFVGAVAALNSLRVLGHSEPAFVLDVGLSDAQRGALARTAEIVPCPQDVKPRLAKWVVPLAHPSDVMVLVDADMIVTRQLGPLLDDAERGSVVVFADDHPDRFDERWSDFVGVGTLRRRTYVNSGFVVLPPRLGLDVLANLRSLQTRLAELGHTRIRDDDRSGLFSFPDQDSWNAVLSAIVADDVLKVLPHELAPFQRERPRVIDSKTLTCRTAGGERPYLLHHIGPKPWRGQHPANAYTKLLPRLLFADDVAVRLDPSELPAGLRPGARGAVERLRLQVGLGAHRLRRRVRARSAQASP